MEVTTGNLFGLLFGALIGCVVILTATLYRVTKDLKFWKCEAERISIKHNDFDKQRIEQDLRLYQSQERLRIDTEIFTKEQGNWCIINEFREKRRKTQIEELGYKIDIARLEGKKEGLAESLKAKDDMLAEYKTVVEKLANIILERSKQGNVSTYRGLPGGGN